MIPFKLCHQYSDWTNSSSLNLKQVNTQLTTDTTKANSKTEFKMDSRATISTETRNIYIV